MLVGHYAAAFAIKTRFPEASLWALFLGAQAVDIAFFALGFLGIESARIRPGERPVLEVTAGVYTHSLLLTCGYVAACFVVGWLARRPRLGAAFGLALGSHWVLDLVVHVPDLPLGWTQEPAVGLGLWRLPVVPWLLEIALLLGGYAPLRVRLTQSARRRADRVVGVLISVQLANALVVPTPADMLSLGGSALGLYLGCALLAWSVDRAQRPRDAEGSSLDL